MNRNVLKILLMIFMTMDHYAYAFLKISSWQFQLMRFFGRMVAPTMCYLLVEGFTRTRNFWRYAGRMAFFAVLAHVPYLFLLHRRWMLDPSQLLSTYESSMLFTLLVCLLMLKGYQLIENSGIDEIWKTPAEGALTILTICVSQKGDWAVYAPLFVSVCYFFRDDEAKTMLAMAGVSALCIMDSYQGLSPRYLDQTIRYLLFELGMFGSLILIRLYDHTRGRLNLKYLFYLYYPVHLALIDLMVYHSIVR